LAAALPAGLIAIGGLLTYDDFYNHWLQQPDVLAYLGQYDNEAAKLIKDSSSEQTPVYLPYSLYVPWNDPRTQFRTAYLSPRPVGLFDWRQCWAVSAVPAIYAVPSDDRTGFVAGLSRFAEIKTIGQVTIHSSASPVFEVLRVVPHSASSGEANTIQAAFASLAQVSIRFSGEARARPNESIPLEMMARALQPLDRDYSVFIHLYDASRLNTGEAPLSQSDSQLCPSHPTSLWHTQESVAQNFVLPIPADLPAGDYVIAFGVYDSGTLARLPVTAPPGSRDYVEIGHVQVEP
jgi:hypothetical protein